MSLNTNQPTNHGLVMANSNFGKTAYLFYNLVFIDITFLYGFIFGGKGSVTVIEIFIENGHRDPSSNPEEGCLCFTLHYCPQERYGSILSPSNYG